MESSSEGDREISGRLTQNIMDVTEQKSSLVRSLRSTVVIDVAQEEQEQLTTYVIANNNRAHALSIVYFELLNRYLVEMRTARIEPLIFIPFLPLDFDFDLIAAYWHVIRLGVTNANLVTEVDQLLTSVDYFEGTLQSAADTTVEELKVDLTVGIPFSGLTPPGIVSDFRIECLRSEGEDFVIDNIRLLSMGGYNNTFRFREEDLNIPLSSIRGFRVSSPILSVTPGNNINLKISEMKLRTGEGSTYIRNMDLGSRALSAGSPIADFSFNADGYVAESQIGLTMDRIVDHVRRRRYFFTRFVLMGIDTAEFEDLLEVILVKSFDGGTMRLTALVQSTANRFCGGIHRFQNEAGTDYFRLQVVAPG